MTYKVKCYPCGENMEDDMNEMERNGFAVYNVIPTRSESSFSV